MDLEQTNSNHSDIRRQNFIEEINTLNQQMQNSSSEIYKISSSWDKNPNAQNNKNIEITIKEVLNYLIKIDATLIKIESALTNNKSENKRETKSFWDNFRF